MAPIEALLTSPGALALAAVLGAMLGSFANVVILRVPARRSIVSPGSACFGCGRPIAWYDNIPIVSYVLLRGRCRGCRAPFSPRYLLVEAATAMLLGGLYYLCLFVLAPEQGPGPRLLRFAAYALLGVLLVILSFIDLDTKRIPDVISLPAVPVLLGLGLLLGDERWLDLVIGGAGGYLLVRGISDGYYLLTRREGLGYGDGKLLAMIGALLGWRAVLFTLFAGALLGSVIGVSALVVARRRQPPAAGEPPLRHVEIPFGPFLAAAALLYVFGQGAIRPAFRLFFL